MRVDMENSGATVHVCASPRSETATRDLTAPTEATNGIAVSTGSGTTILKLFVFFLK